MKIVLLSTSAHGTLGHHLPILHQSDGIEISMVIVAPGLVADKKKRYKRLFKKILKIGAFGAFNGVKMRKWYNEDVEKYCKIGDAQAFCNAHNIPFYTAPSTNSKVTQDLFRESGAEVGLSLGNGYITSKVFSIPRYGMLNVHHELLPQYQNAQSIIWEIYNGSSDTGFTIHKINKEIDKGEILLQRRLPIAFRDSLADTVAYNYARLFDASAQGFIDLFADFYKYFDNATPQGKGTNYTTPSYRQYLKICRNFGRLKETKK